MVDKIGDENNSLTLTVSVLIKPHAKAIEGRLG
jgi:hypothetical protein